ncbi:MAG: tRNA (N(6)-L-threonylcarbamoyladenosine(37)-C(2))-methylthiotransferase MtaB [Deltaproteobacteria bacterium]|nr:tRNA (N(6)-L-threonylcarbamoyladenosine(37)-C(2))-methylthiotransferase MtaB [Deltaproteobacteria bacterium]
MKKIAIATLGCKVNQFESASFSSSLTRAGCEIVPFNGRADIYVINTCAVTGRAGQQSRQLIRRAMKTNPAARLVITGCYAQAASRKILEITDNRSVCIVGNGNKDLVLDAALAENGCDLPPGDIGMKREICRLPVRRFNGRTRAFLRIQDGCNNFCSYCIVPHTRGRSRSLALPEVLEQAAIFSEEGYRELVITGINVGKYGLDLDEEETIYTLLARLCREFPDMRFRLSSIEPTEVNDSLLELMTRAPNFMPHLHIPLQSGDDAILRRMNRRYPVAAFARAVQQSHDALPHIAIGCDILGGFPGEDNAAHDNTRQLLAGLPVTYLHVFPFSRRPGTPAASMKDQVPKQIKDERVSQLRALGREKKLEFYRRHVGTIRQVLVERRNKKTGLLKGFSENYIPVQFQGPARLTGQVVAIRIDRLDKDEPFGTLQNE